MKIKNNTFVFLSFMAVFLLAAGTLCARQVSIDEAVIEAARGIEEALPQGAVVAALNLSSPSAAFSPNPFKTAQRSGFIRPVNPALSDHFLQKIRAKPCAS